MGELIDSYKNSGHLHHAYFLVGDSKKILPKLLDFLENKVGIKILGNPDFWQIEFKTLTIENARILADAQSRAAFAKDSGQPMKIFIVETESISREAQNALLKIFEEPTINTHFFIISPQDNLLPTLRSRMQVIFQNELSRTVLGRLPRTVLDRLKMVREITEAISDEEKSKQDAINLVNQIEIELYQNGIEKSFDSLKICEQARISLYDRGAPMKMILENLILSI